MRRRPALGPAAADVHHAQHKEDPPHPNQLRSADVLLLILHACVQIYFPMLL